MTYEESIRVLLRGTCGANNQSIVRGTGLSRPAVAHFLSGRGGSQRQVVEAIGMFVFRQMNAKVLLSPEDFEGARD